MRQSPLTDTFNFVHKSRHIQDAVPAICQLPMVPASGLKVNHYSTFAILLSALLLINSGLIHAPFPASGFAMALGPLRALPVNQSYNSQADRNHVRATSEIHKDLEGMAKTSAIADMMNKAYLKVRLTAVLEGMQAEVDKMISEQDQAAESFSDGESL